MVADIRLLQGKIIEDLDQNPKNFTKLMKFNLETKCMCQLNL